MLDVCCHTGAYDGHRTAKAPQRDKRIRYLLHVSEAYLGTYPGNPVFASQPVYTAFLPANTFTHNEMGRADGEKGPLGAEPSLVPT